MSAESFLQIKSPLVVGVQMPAFVAGWEASYWQFDGEPGRGAVPPTTYEKPDNTTAGGMQQSNPPAGKQKWLTSLMASADVSGRLVLYDRLLHISGLSGTVSTAQNINGGSPATLSRHYKDAQSGVDVGNEIFLEIYTTIGASVVTVTCSYANQAGALNATQAVSWGGTNRNTNTRVVRLPLAAGDTGVQSVTSVTQSGTTGTAGNYGIVVAHRLLEIEVGNAYMGEIWSGVDGSAREILTNACLAWTFVPAIVNNSSLFTQALVAFPTFVDW